MLTADSQANFSCPWVSWVCHSPRLKTGERAHRAGVLPAAGPEFKSSAHMSSTEHDHTCLSTQCCEAGRGKSRNCSLLATSRASGSGQILREGKPGKVGSRTEPSSDLSLHTPVHTDSESYFRTGSQTILISQSKCSKQAVVYYFP